MNHDALKRAQDSVDRELNTYRSTLSKKNQDTIMALAHITENIDWYRYESLDDYSGNRQDAIIRKLKRHFSDLDERIVRRRLTRYGFLSNFQFAIFLIVLIMSCSTILTYVFDYEDKILLVPHWGVTLTIGAFITFVGTLIHSENYWIRLYRVKKDL